MLQSRPILLVGASPNAATGANGSIIQSMFGLAEYSQWVMTARFAGTLVGGVLDVYLQTQDVDAGAWSDICHFPQIAAGVVALAYRASFWRGANPPGTPTVVNAADVPPALAANTLLPWANGSALRLLVVAGAGTTAGIAISITGTATSEG